MIKKIMPKYGYIPVISVFVFNLIVYYGTKLINGNMTHYDLAIGLDSMIPTLSPFVVIYALAYIQWIFGYIMIARDSKQLCYYYITSELIAKFICGICFILVPTVMVRPDIMGTDIFSKGLSIVYSMDTPTNLFPSIHILESYLIARAGFQMEKVGKGYRVGMVILSTLIALSVLFTKQHLLVDIIGGILVAELGLFIYRKMKGLWTRKR